jgi:thiamine-monophosphate kinase
LLALDMRCRDWLADRYRLPQPRLALGQALQATAGVHAAMDVSDGLVGDAMHIAEASHCGLVIHADRVPLSPAAEQALADDLDLLPVILTGGDDYEVLFAAEAAIPKQDTLVTEIGEVVSGSGVRVLDRDGVEISLAQAGFRHF